jgi:hypothetical protein
MPQQTADRQLRLRARERGRPGLSLSNPWACRSARARERRERESEREHRLRVEQLVRKTPFSHNTRRNGCERGRLRKLIYVSTCGFVRSCIPSHAAEDVVNIARQTFAHSCAIGSSISSFWVMQHPPHHQSCAFGSFQRKLN